MTRQTIYRTTRPMWESVINYLLAVGIALSLVLAITTWWTT